MGPSLLTYYLTRLLHNQKSAPYFILSLVILSLTIVGLYYILFKCYIFCVCKCACLASANLLAGPQLCTSENCVLRGLLFLNININLSQNIICNTKSQNYSVKTIEKSF